MTVPSVLVWREERAQDGALWSSYCQAAWLRHHIRPVEVLDLMENHPEMIGRMFR